jgi:release factor glutamine methyltransferase
MPRLGALLRRGTEVLGTAGIEQPAREARLLLLHTLGRPPGALLDPEAEADATAFEALLARRASREPLAFLTGRQGFWTLDLAVSPATLIPRADTETLIEAAIAAFPDRAQIRRVLDLGTGTGALLLAALVEFPTAWGLGVDRNPEAAALAQANARTNGLAARAAFVCGDWAAALAARFDLIVCNPPYIESAAIAGLMPEVAEHEPRSALDGGPAGLDAYRALLPDLPRLLAPGGAAVLELGIGQDAPVAVLAAECGLFVAGLHCDLGKVSRAIVLRPPVGI